jgi:hypothetical protein
LYLDYFGFRERPFDVMPHPRYVALAFCSEKFWLRSNTDAKANGDPDSGGKVSNRQDDCAVSTIRGVPELHQHAFLFQTHHGSRHRLPTNALTYFSCKAKWKGMLVPNRKEGGALFSSVASGMKRL